ncbi:TIGR03758 family integrating conjugative element protein [Niveibacterium sp. 24ML]|uniref:TIGR03758 family integrating conjugative element protein n=1 Tax=Niveibacterium sp. 24ML TaxID=2985512 RepID=UPI00226E0832|nr:TIGR03758 family integrating conjugative element protein [Niveibacterium sp. 24ML]MCX9158089.1 TIGR03758 family integrating conjugative element protein [Niveibacterium sp. 24ML]
MSPTQAAAFQAASGEQPGAVLLVVAMALATPLLLWLAWLAFALFREWQERTLDQGEFMTYLVRGAVLASVLLYFIH